MTTYEGGCLCGGVRYCLESDVAAAGHCHCSICRRVHGAAFGTYLTVPESAFRWLEPKKTLTSFESTPGSFRYFCARCGSPLACVLAHSPESIDVTVATLDDPSDVRVVAHVFVASKAPWYEITDTLAQFDAWLPGAEPHGQERGRDKRRR